MSAPQPFKKQARRVLPFVVAAVPAVMTFLLLYLNHASLFDFVPPARGNDETVYWHSIATFNRVGFEGGYYTIEENPARATFSRLGIYGPAFAMIYGSLGHVLGWHLYSGPLFHLIFITAALGVFFYLSRLGGAALVCCAFFLATYWPMLLYTITNAQEGMHYAIAIVHAGMFCRLTAIEKPVSNSFMALCTSFNLGAAMSRITWIVLLFPLLFLALRKRAPKRALLAIPGAALGGVLVWLATSYLNAPFKGLLLLPVVRGSNMAELFERLVERAYVNTVAFFYFSGTPLEILHRYLFVLVILIVIGHLIVSTRRQAFVYLMVHFFNLVVILMLILLFYIIGNFGDYRVSSVHILLSVMFLIATRVKGYRMALALIVIANLALAPASLSVYKSFVANGFGEERPRRIARFHEELDGALEYAPGRDPWCNSLTLWYEEPFFYFPELVAIPPGIGINLVLDLESGRRRSARYLLISAERYRKLRGQMRLRRIKSTAFGELYLNLDSRCDELRQEPGRHD